jgi:phospholipid/cholesterol/gamma-HCH transport system substrate-binding protein
VRLDSRGYRYKLLALLGVGALVLSIFVVVASYTRMFASVVRAEVLADRSGLLLDRKADVTLRGITVGEAREIRSENGKAVIDIAIDTEYVDAIPDNVTAQIISPTVFGAKFVDLVPPPTPSGQVVQDGSIIQATGVSTETNAVFDSLMNLLTAVKPAKLNATLGAISTALRGRGSDLGQFVTDLNTYLTRFNPTLPAVDQDLRSLPDVAGTYADVSPELVRIVDNAAALSTTIQDKEAGLHAFLLSVTRVSDTGNAVLTDNGRQLVNLLDTLRPTTELLAYYSPQYPCMFRNANLMRIGSAEVVGGQYNGIHGSIAFLPGQPGYQKGLDDPKLALNEEPFCVPPRPGAPHIVFDDGTTTVDFYRETTEIVTPLELARKMLGPSIERFLPGGAR